MTQKIYRIDKKKLSSPSFLELLNTFKEALRYFFNAVILFNTVFYLQLNFKLKIDPKTCNFKNLEEIWKPGESLLKTFGDPVNLF